MFRRQKPPAAPGTPTPPETPATPAPADGGYAAPAGFRPTEPGAVAPAATTPIADQGSDTSPRTMMNTTFSSATGASTTTNAAPSLKTEIPRRVVDIPNSPPKRVAPTGVEGSSPAVASEMRKLIVGRDISLSGEIAACDVLVVEGTVEAKLRDGHVVEITDGGLFKGSVEIDEADIGGRFDGDITVRGTLKVRATGRITGNIRYGTLEVENGGQLAGTIQVLGEPPVIVPASVADVAIAAAEAPSSQPAFETAETVG